MKRILILAITAILLLGCGDSKETTSKHIPNTPITSRAIAQIYQVKTNSDGASNVIKCYPDIANQDASIDLTNNQQVSLVLGNEVFVIVNNIQWLHIFADKAKKQPCYVQTSFLAPVPNY